jgi:hypothetical protein
MIGEMEKPRVKSKRLPEKKTYAGKLNRKELKALKVSVKFLNEQADRLGLLDPLETEPAMVFLAKGKAG